MLAIDTNIVVRYLTGDDKRMSPAALKLVGENSVFVSVTVLLEAEWVLRNAYEMPRERVIGELRKFFGLETVTVAEAEKVAKALAYAERGLDLADALHLVQSEGCEAFVTFDKKFARRARSFDGVAIRLA